MSTHDGVRMYPAALTHCTLRLGAVQSVVERALCWHHRHHRVDDRPCITVVVFRMLWSGLFRMRECITWRCRVKIKCCQCTYFDSGIYNICTISIRREIRSTNNPTHVHVSADAGEHEHVDGSNTTSEMEA